MKALRETLSLLRMRTGHDFSYKRGTILGRVGRRMQVSRIDDLPGYVAFLRSHSEEAISLEHIFWLVGPISSVIKRHSGSFVGVHAFYEGRPGNPGSDGASPYHPSMRCRLLRAGLEQRFLPRSGPSP